MLDAPQDDDDDGNSNGFELQSIDIGFKILEVKTKSPFSRWKLTEPFLTPGQIEQYTEAGTPLYEPGLHLCGKWDQLNNKGFLKENVAKICSIS
jgi:hypothetical protein